MFSIEKIQFVCFVLLLPFMLQAQVTINISGRLLDGVSHDPLPFATVTLQAEAEQAVLGGAITDLQGRFVIKGTFQGKYEVFCSFIGYESQTIPVLIGQLNSDFDLGKIDLFPAAETLDEVTVTAQKAIVSAALDRKSFNLQDNIAQAGGSLLDAMKTLPGINIDQEGKVILRGSDKVLVLIDGKQSSLTGFGNQKGLDNIPATNIERIEIINNPSAKYDAAGMAGIINIIYKKEKETGLNGDVGLSYGLGVLAQRKDDLPTDLGSFTFTPKYIPSLNLNYKTPKVNLFVQSEILDQKKLPNNEFTSRFYDDGITTLSQVPENRTQTHYILKSGLDWQINSRNSLSLSGIYDYEHHIDTSQVAYINSPSNRRYRYWHWSEDEVTGYTNLTLQYDHDFEEPGHQYNASLQYTKGWEDEAYFLNDSSALRIGTDTTHIIATEYTTSAAVNYVKPLKSGRLEMGSRLQIRRIPVEYTIGPGVSSIIYPGLGNESRWGENIYAAYLNYVWERPGYDIEAGLRVEQTDVFYEIDPANIYYDENDAYDYLELFPNIRLTFKADPANSISLFFNRRVDRPGEPELRIFPKFDDPELLKVGNPYLRPQFTETFEVAYKNIWREGSLFLSLFYRNINDPFTRVFAIDDSSNDYSVINKIYQNVGRGTNAGAEIIVTQKIGKAWTFSGNLNYYRNTFDDHQGTILFPFVRPFQIQASSDDTWDIKISNQFRLPKQFQVQLTGIYFAAKNIPQGRQASRSSVDIGLKKAILTNRGEIVLSFSDIFNDFGIKQEISAADFTAVYENFFETQVITLGLRYKF